jgi:pyruvate ferredoxin oxidoreductase gamma subunit
MQQIRIHGRGGQGSVTLGHLIAEAAFAEGQWSQAFPQFGVERRGAPVEAFARVDDEKITDRSHVYEPDYVIVQDPSLIEFVDVCKGLDGEGTIIVNTSSSPEELGLDTEATVLTVDATEIAMEHIERPIMNTALLGAFASASGIIELDSIESVIMDTFPGEIGERNVAASSDAFQVVTGA